MEACCCVQLLIWQCYAGVTGKFAIPSKVLCFLLWNRAFWLCAYLKLLVELDMAPIRWGGNIVMKWHWGSSLPALRYFYFHDGTFSFDLWYRKEHVFEGEYGGRRKEPHNSASNFFLLLFQSVFLGNFIGSATLLSSFSSDIEHVNLIL